MLYTPGKESFGLYPDFLFVPVISCQMQSESSFYRRYIVWNAQTTLFTHFLSFQFCDTRIYEYYGVRAIFSGGYIHNHELCELTYLVCCKAHPFGLVHHFQHPVDQALEFPVYPLNRSGLLS